MEDQIQKPYYTYQYDSQVRLQLNDSKIKDDQYYGILDSSIVEKKEQVKAELTLILTKSCTDDKIMNQVKRIVSKAKQIHKLHLILVADLYPLNAQILINILISLKNLAILSLPQIKCLGENQAEELLIKLKQCQNLQSLQLHFENFKKLSVCLKALSKIDTLKELDLSIRLSETGNLEQIQILTGLKKLEKLKINSINLEIQEQSEIGTIFSKFSVLKSLDLNFTNAYSFPTLKFFSGIQKCHHLYELYLNLNYLTSRTNLKLLASYIGQIKRLRVLHLNLSKSDLSEEGGEFFSIILTNCTKIADLSLDLRECKLKTDTFQQLGESLQASKNIQKLQLNLTSNIIEQQGLLHLKSGIGNQAKLKDLKLNFSDTKIDVSGINDFCLIFKQLEALQFLEFNLGDDLLCSKILSSQFGDQLLFENRLCSIKNLTNLSLRLSTYEFKTSENLRNLFLELTNCQQLKILYLHLNLKVIENNEFPFEVKSHQELQQFKLQIGYQFNKVRNYNLEFIKEWIIKCKKVNYIYFSKYYNLGQARSTYFYRMNNLVKISLL